MRRGGQVSESGAWDLTCLDDRQCPFGGREKKEMTDPFFCLCYGEREEVAWREGGEGKEVDQAIVSLANDSQRSEDDSRIPSSWPRVQRRGKNISNRGVGKRQIQSMTALLNFSQFQGEERVRISKSSSWEEECCNERDTKIPHNLVYSTCSLSRSIARSIWAATRQRT